MYLYNKKVMEETLTKMNIRNLRDWQVAPLDAVLQGRDVFVSMSTGGGKSLLYQLPAAMEEGRGLTIVISPLRALQSDQVNALISKNIAACCINADMTASARQNALARLPQIALLYIAPEQLCNQDLLAALESCHVQRVVLDEAHVLPLSELDFRRAYGQIDQFIQKLPERPQIVACTATATVKDRRRIVEALDMRDVASFIFPIRRNNLRLRLKKVDVECGPGKKERLKHSLLCAVERRLEKWDKTGSVIIYAPTVKRVQLIYKWLKRRGWSVAKYTGQQPQNSRRKAQEDFQSGRKSIMVATNAFGLGIDKADIRLIIHAGLPLSMDGYVQEIGRAGRDGKKSKCFLLYTNTDIKLNEAILRNGENDSGLQRKLKGLYALEEMLKSHHCVWKCIERYFGEKPHGNCGKCTRCKSKSKI